MPNYDTVDRNGWYDSAPRGYAFANRNQQLRAMNPDKPSETPTVKSVFEPHQIASRIFSDYRSSDRALWEPAYDEAVQIIKENVELKQEIEHIKDSMSWTESKALDERDKLRVENAELRRNLEATGQVVLARDCTINELRRDVERLNNDRLALCGSLKDERSKEAKRLQELRQSQQQLTTLLSVAEKMELCFQNQSSNSFAAQKERTEALSAYAEFKKDNNIP